MIKINLMKRFTCTGRPLGLERCPDCGKNFVRYSDWPFTCCQDCFAESADYTDETESGSNGRGLQTLKEFLS